ncbi:hypothetical protein [Acinetobacter terrae]|jgi:hypothetical protein|uniref:hypothetical protein n=1 Tax=Acinetobacter terrae TaxID=2731247 RepID=UPI0007D8053A|nr:hypothetical protein [Acinetobacter terrae]MDD2940829.1 hypothetical protein [Acinetobacter harbinensis]NNH14623.1 hypothetical protein [Acinetobacter terrae]OAL88415.1 hypothetical protein AY608_01090 [Acinetobacter terrae]
MKFKTLILSGFACLSLTACTSAPKIPQLETGVLQEVQNLKVYPDTVNNKAKLTKVIDKCVIEFTGNLEAGKSIEHWSFKGLTLISGGSTTFAQDGSSTATNFDLHAPDVQHNFLALRHNFHKDALAQCN